MPCPELGALTPWGSEAAPRRSWGLRSGSGHGLHPVDGVQGSRWQMRSLRGRVACQGQRHTPQELASSSRAVRPHSPKTSQGPASHRPASDTAGCLWQGQGKGLNRVSRPLPFHLSTRGRAVGLSPCSVAHPPNPHGPGRSVWFLRAWGPRGSFLISGVQGSGLPVCFSEWTPGGRRSPYTGRARRAFGRCLPSGAQHPQPAVGLLLFLPEVP